MHRPSLEELRQLSVEERLKLMEDVWTTLEEERELLIPQWHKEELERRIKAFEEDPDSGAPWSEVKERLLERS